MKTIEEYKKMSKAELANKWFWMNDHCTQVIFDQVWLDLGDFEIELTKSEIEYRASLFLEFVRNESIQQQSI